MIKGIASGILAVSVAFFSNNLFAGEWPQKPIKLIVPLAPGGSTDSTARLFAQKLATELGQPVIVENKAGASGNIGAGYVAKSKPDGYTLLFTSSTFTANETLFPNLPYGVKKDFIPVAGAARIPNVLVVNKEFPATTLNQFVDYVRKQKGEINYGSAGSGSSQHLSGALINHLLKGKMIHVPYQGGAPANLGLMSGQVQAVFSPLVEVLPYIESGKVRALGVTTIERSKRLPQIPSISEVLPGVSIVLWNGIFAPKGTPSETINTLNRALTQVQEDPTIKQTLEDQGSIPISGTQDDFKKLVDESIDSWAKMVEISGAQKQ